MSTVRNWEELCRPKDYEGWGMTDIDGMIERDDKVFVIVDTKFNKPGAINKFLDSRGGQKLLFERTCNAIDESGRVAATIIGIFDEPSGKIYVKRAKAALIYRNGRWNRLDCKENLKDFVEDFIKKHLTNT